MDPESVKIIVLIMVMLVEADSIISSNLIAGVVVGAAIIVVVAEVGSSVAATRCNISLVEHRHNEGEEDPADDNYSVVAGLG